jgi:hypothetical protein
VCPWRSVDHRQGLLAGQVVQAAQLPPAPQERRDVTEDPLPGDALGLVELADLVQLAVGGDVERAAPALARARVQPAGLAPCATGGKRFLLLCIVDWCIVEPLS